MAFTKHFLSAMILVTLILNSAIAQEEAAQQTSPQERAKKALEEGDRKLALAIYQNHAYAGEVWAQIILAQINQDSQKPSIANAVEWYARAAFAGSAEAQFRLGLIFCDDQNKENHRPRKCFDWLQRAASNDHPGALYQLAILAHRSQYVNSDLASARILASQALDAGVTEAKELLAQIDEDIKSFEQKVTLLTTDILVAEYNPNKYTVRLAIFDSQAQLLRFVQQSSLQNLYAYLAGDFWVLSHGSFTSQQKAQAAITNFDETIRNLKPQALKWSDVISNLQKNAAPAG